MASKAVQILMDRIKQIESSGNPDAVSEDGAVGLYQIMPDEALADWNTYHPKETHTINALWNPVENEKIAQWYMNERIPQMLKHYKLQDTVDNRLAAYNAGIGNLRKIRAGTMKMPSETSKYIRKYYGLE